MFAAGPCETTGAPGRQSVGSEQAGINLCLYRSLVKPVVQLYVMDNQMHLKASVSRVPACSVILTRDRRPLPAAPELSFPIGQEQQGCGAEAYRPAVAYRVHRKESQGRAFSGGQRVQGGPPARALGCPSPPGPWPWTRMGRRAW